MKTKGFIRVVIGVLAAVMFAAAQVAVVPVVNPTGHEVQAASKIKLSKSKATLYVKQTVTLKVKGTKKKAKWSSSNKKVAQVSKKGKVTAVKQGTATITAKVGKKKYKCKVTVKNPTLAPTSAAVTVGKSVQLKVSHAVGAVKWSSGNTAFATVSNQGVVTGKKVGTVNVTALASGVKLNCKVTVNPVPVTGVSLDQSTLNLEVGETGTLQATVLPENATNRNVSWESSNAEVATVAGGVVTAVGAGTATITVKTEDGNKTAGCTVTVETGTVHVTGVTLDPTVANLAVGKSITLGVTVTPAYADETRVNWESDAPDVAEVDGNGLVTAKKDGSATITVTTVDGGKTASCAVTVKTELKGLDVENPEITIDAGAEEKIKPVVTPEECAGNVSFTFAPNKPGIVSVDEEGNVTGIKTGNVEITVTARDQYKNVKTKKVSAVVKTRAKYLNVNSPKSPATLYQGSTATIDATVLPVETADKSVSYTSSNPSVATVSEEGIVTGVAAGNVDITVTSNDNQGLEQTIRFTVKNSTTRIVANQKELTAALKNSTTFNMLRIQTESNVKLRIPSGDYSGISLIINAENAQIENQAHFRDVTILAIGEQGYVQSASENQINYAAPDGTITIADGGRASITTLPDAGNLRLINQGTIKLLTVTSSSVIRMEGYGVQIPVKLKSSAANTIIQTASFLQIEAEALFALKVESGGENTTVRVQKEEQIPIVEGIGRIAVTIDETGEVKNIVARETNPLPEQEVLIQGKIENAPEGTKVSIIPYYAEAIDPENARVTAETDEDGNYRTETEIPIGNYYLYVKEDGYITIKETLIITGADSENVYQAQTVVMIEGDETVRGNLLGELIDAETGTHASEGLTVFLRAGGNNISDEFIDFTYTDPDGRFRFEEIPLGTYTVQVVDQRETDEAPYISFSFNATVSAEGINMVRNTVSREIGPEQVRFVLTWGDEASGAVKDLDSHLVGPKAEGDIENEEIEENIEGVEEEGDLENEEVEVKENREELFHIYYNDECREYSFQDVKYAGLDVDDKDWEGPETTTIYQTSPGIYSFYVRDFASDDPTKMCRSSAEVKAYIGSALMATYTFPVDPENPEQEANYWYVCDFDPSKNQFIEKRVTANVPEGTMASYDDGIELIQADRYKGEVKRLIEQLDQILAENPDYETEELLTELADANEILNNPDYLNDIVSYLDDIEEYDIKDAYRKMSDAVFAFTDGLLVSQFNAFEGVGNDVISEFFIEDGILYAYGSAEELPDDLEALAFGDSDAEVVDFEQDEDQKAVKVTNRYGISKQYRIVYEKEAEPDASDTGGEEGNNEDNTP